MWIHHTVTTRVCSSSARINHNKSSNSISSKLYTNAALRVNRHFIIANVIFNYANVCKASWSKHKRVKIYQVQSNYTRANFHPSSLRRLDRGREWHLINSINVIWKSSDSLLTPDICRVHQRRVTEKQLCSLSSVMLCCVIMCCETVSVSLWTWRPFSTYYTQHTMLVLVICRAEDVWQFSKTKPSMKFDRMNPWGGKAFLCCVNGYSCHLFPGKMTAVVMRIDQLSDGNMTPAWKRSFSALFQLSALMLFQLMFLMLGHKKAELYCFKQSGINMQQWFCFLYAENCTVAVQHVIRILPHQI